MSELQIFNNPEFGKIRGIEIDGDPWFVGKDVAEALDYKDTSDALKRHVETDDKLTRRFTGTGQAREMTIINESGLYSLIFSSKLPKAKDFKHWVTSEVLPTIRKTGTYVINQCTHVPEKTGEVARYITVVARYMEKQGSPAFEIVRMIQQISLQHGIHLPDNIVKPIPFQFPLESQ